MIASHLHVVKQLDLQVIGLCGKSGTGKDTVYEEILQKLGFLRLGFSIPFKVDMLAKGDATFDEIFSTKPPKVRE